MLVSDESRSCLVPQDLPNLRWHTKISRWSTLRLLQRGVRFCRRLFASLGLLTSGRPRAYLYTRGFPRPRVDSPAFRYAAPGGRGRAGLCNLLGGDRGVPSWRRLCIWSPCLRVLGTMYQQLRQGRIVPSLVVLSCTSCGRCAFPCAPLQYALV